MSSISSDLGRYVARYAAQKQAGILDNVGAAASGLKGDLQKHFKGNRMAGLAGGGAGLGALIGGAGGGLSALFADEDEDGNKPSVLGRGLAGALGGGALGAGAGAGSSALLDYVNKHYKNKTGLQPLKS